MSCSDNTLLKGVKDKQKELNTLLAGGKDNLASMGTKMAAMKADLASFVPAIPEVPSLQGDLLKLGDITSAGGLVAKLAELKASMGSAVPDFDSLISGLGLDSFPPSLDASAICSTMPNVETVDGVATVVPAESKVPEEEPKKPEPKPVIEPNLEELNKKVLAIAYTANAKGLIKKNANKIRKRKRIRQDYYDLTWIETRVELANAGGGDFDDLKFIDYPLAVLRELQSQLEAKHQVGWDFISEGQKIEAAYNTTKQLLPEWQAAEDFGTAAAQYVARRKKRIASNV